MDECHVTSGTPYLSRYHGNPYTKDACIGIWPHACNVRYKENRSIYGMYAVIPCLTRVRLKLCSHHLVNLFFHFILTF